MTFKYLHVSRFHHEAGNSYESNEDFSSVLDIFLFLPNIILFKKTNANDETYGKLCFKSYAQRYYCVKNADLGNSIYSVI